jgi:hypothetical protein
MLAIQRRLADTREIIVLRNQYGAEEQLTNGPSDVTPAFAPDGRALVYSRFRTGEIVECGLESHRCRTVHTEKLLAAYPVIDPSGRWIAYLTALGASRVRVISRATGGPESDLGPAQSCGPVWSTSKALWVVASLSPSAKTWAEIDVETGKRTGRTKAVPSIAEDECSIPLESPTAEAAPARVIPLVRDISYLTSRSLLAAQQ